MFRNINCAYFENHTKHTVWVNVLTYLTKQPHINYNIPISCEKWAEY